MAITSFIWNEPPVYSFLFSNNRNFSSLHFFLNILKINFKGTGSHQILFTINSLTIFFVDYSTSKLLGIKTDLLKSKPLFTRSETEEIFRCTHQTLKSFERKELIKPNKFKNKNFYSTNEILSFIKKQVPIAYQILKEDMEWNDIWK